MQRFFLFLFLTYFSFPSYNCNAQTAASNPFGYTSYQVWTNLSLLQDISKKWATQFDIQLFSAQNFASTTGLGIEPASLTWRAWGHYFPNPDSRISASIDAWEYYPNDEMHQTKGIEYRPAFQFQQTWKWNNFTFIGRARDEFRWIKNQTASSYAYSNRLRLMPKVIMSLYTNSNKQKSIYLVCYDELFLGKRAPKIVSQNRISFGLGYALNRYTTIETSYIHRTINPLLEYPQNTHALVINLRFNNLWHHLK
ncbi:MAG: DUF2490 domain-containing protein [Bacteroidia bacterium]|nr:DUF2490 domain-containing protein [Bacteroidia bacterium]MCF8426667.1 DUF2490 domain-containing protein [Bacteroidia bacterium]MCF8446722.1 DUF2490 domain-containing protein [Bacteroidia bacterium]